MWCSTKLMKCCLERLGHLARMSDQRVRHWLEKTHPKCGPKRRWSDININMIGVSGRRQSLYTSRSWDLTLEVNCTKHVWKESERRKNPWLEPAAKKNLLAANISVDILGMIWPMIEESGTRHMLRELLTTNHHHCTQVKEIMCYEYKRTFRRAANKTRQNC